MLKPLSSGVGHLRWISDSIHRPNNARSNTGIPFEWNISMIFDFFYSVGNISLPHTRIQDIINLVLRITKFIQHTQTDRMIKCCTTHRMSKKHQIVLARGSLMMCAVWIDSYTVQTQPANGKEKQRRRERDFKCSDIFVLSYTFSLNT